MKTNVCELNNKPECLTSVLSEVDKAAAYNSLTEKNTLRLHLLAEELCGMLPGLLENFGGVFWLENDQNTYELHTELRSTSIDLETRDSLIALSTSGKNAAAKGIMGKIRAAAEVMLLSESVYMGVPAVHLSTETALSMGLWSSYPMGAWGVVNNGAAGDGSPCMWSMRYYQSAVEKAKNEDAMEELERSIVANLADDIIVGVRGEKVEIVVKKTF